MRDELTNLQIEARAAKHAADSAQMMTSVAQAQAVPGPAMSPREERGIPVGVVQLYLSCTNPPGPPPYVYDVYLDEDHKSKFIPGTATGLSNAAEPSTKGLGRYKQTSPTLAVPEVITLFEETTAESPKTLEQLITDSEATGQYEIAPLVFVLEDKIIELNVLVKKMSPEETATATKQEWTLNGTPNDARKVLQVEDSSESAPGKLRVNYAYLKSGS